MATGRSRWAFLSSLPANPTLFHASIEKREPTIAAPIVPRPTAAPPVAQKLAPKLAANASALRPMVMPSRISKASAPVLIAVRDVRSEEHTSELQSRLHLVCRLLLEKKKKSRVRRRAKLVLQ